MFAMKISGNYSENHEVSETMAHMFLTIKKSTNMEITNLDIHPIGICPIDVPMVFNFSHAFSWCWKGAGESIW